MRREHVLLLWWRPRTGSHINKVNTVLWLKRSVLVCFLHTRSRKRNKHVSRIAHNRIERTERQLPNGRRDSCKTAQ
jgi:hypothetical protein